LSVAQFHELSYANPNQAFVKRLVIRSVEGLSGRNRYFGIYDIWRRDVVPTGENVFGRMLDLAGIGLSVDEPWPPRDLSEGPLVLIANHPFGIGDGAALLALAEKLRRPFKVLIHNDLLKISEIARFALPISFEETKDAVELNLRTRQEAVKLLKQGGVVVIFPAGGVATAPRAFGKARDLPWKMFVARLVQAAQASVIPVHFSGQNGRVFQIVSKFSLTLRLSLLIREFKRLSGKTIEARIGKVLPWTMLAEFSDRRDLLQCLYNAVFALERERQPTECRRSLALRRFLRRPERPKAESLH
jgi:putative hemolysin